uniref:Uncharacterized protein n=1 Tax=Phlebotomus papatasi TaxID=29031 RepID=A0A1B0D0V0_PHLPP
MRKIEKLEAETLAKQTNLEQLRREMIELENTLEQEQEALVNKLWKRMDKLEAEKRSLQIKLDQPVSDPTSPKYEELAAATNGDTASNLSSHIQTLRSEVVRLRANLAAAQKETQEKMAQFAQEERCIGLREENLRLQRKLQLEVERREALCRHLSESESSLEMEEERLYTGEGGGGGGGLLAGMQHHRQRTTSSPVPYSPSSSRPLSPGTASRYCASCGQLLGRRTSERFIKPAIPTPSLGGVTNSASVATSGAAATMSVSGMTGGVHPSVTVAQAGGTGTAQATAPATISPQQSSSISFPGSNSAFIQPASPMDTSVCKD